MTPPFAQAGDVTHGCWLVLWALGGLAFLYAVTGLWRKRKLTDAGSCPRCHGPMKSAPMNRAVYCPACYVMEMRKDGGHTPPGPH